VRAQRKLAVGAVDDPLEREADRVAEHVAQAIQRMTSGASVTGVVTPAGTKKIRRSSVLPQRSDDASGTVIRRAGWLDGLWGGTKKVGEGIDTGSATMEAVDETLKVGKGLSESVLLTEGSKTGSDALGAVGGLIGGSEDIGEGASSMRKDGLGIGSAMKVVGGASGVLGGVNKGLGAVGVDGPEQIIKATIFMSGEEIGAWLDFVSGGTKVVGGVNLTGTSQLQYNRARSIERKSTVPEVKAAATALMEIINEKWWAGMWDTGLGAMDIAASYSIPGYTAAAKVAGAASKMGGGDLLWSALNWLSGGKVRTNDVIEEEVEEKQRDLISTVDDLAVEALRGDDNNQLVLLYELAKEVAPDFAQALSRAVKQLPREEFLEKKRLLKGKIWK
jgi:hypothetical protein